MLTQLTQSWIRSNFGAPCDGSNLTRVRVPIIGSVYLHKKVAFQFYMAFKEMEAKGYGKDGTIQSFDGIYNCRKTTSGRSWSSHAWAISVDLNARLCPYGKTYRQLSPGAKVKQDRIYAVMKKWGFYRLSMDLMHFQCIRIVSRPQVNYATIRIGPYTNKNCYLKILGLEKMHGSPYPAEKKRYIPTGKFTSTGTPLYFAMFGPWNDRAIDMFVDRLLTNPLDARFRNPKAKVVVIRR